MKDDKKTKAQLLEEIEQLRSRLADKATGEEKSRQSTFGQDISRRSALKIAWVTPVVLSVPIAGVAPKRASGAPGGPPSMMPSAMPSAMPTRVEPTGMPSAMPTGVPTDAPTAMPTQFDPGGPFAPTAFPSAVEAPVLSNAAAAAAAGALFGLGAKKLFGDSDDGSDPEDEGEA